MIKYDGRLLKLSIKNAYDCKCKTYFCVLIPFRIFEIAIFHLQQKFDWVMLLTGTPVQNNLTELYSLLKMVDKSKFPAQDADDFAKKYADSSNAKSSNKCDALQLFLV